MIQAIWRLFSFCSKPTQIKCLKHLIVGERAHVALERAMGICSGEKTVCDSQCEYWIIYYNRTSNKHCRFNGVITKIHLSRKHTCGGAAPEWRRGRDGRSHGRGQVAAVVARGCGHTDAWKAAHQWEWQLWLNFLLQRLVLPPCCICHKPREGSELY